MDEEGSPVPEWRGSTSPRGQTSLHEPACDQCRIRKVRCNREHPKCSNCKKAKVPCGFSSRGKRVNHTKQLVNDVEVLGKRLDKIEGAMMRCLSAVEKLSASSFPQANPTPPSDIDNGKTPLTDTETDFGSGERGVDSSATSPALEQRKHHRVVDGGFERFYGYGSMYSLYAEANAKSKKLINSPDNSPNTDQDSDFDSPHGSQKSAGTSCGTFVEPGLKAKIQAASDLLQNFGKETYTSTCDDGVPLALPPRSILEIFLETYLTDLNPVFPIFDKRDLLVAISEQYSPNTPMDPAWAACFNNIILETLTAKAGADCKPGSALRNTMDDGLLMSFLMNAQRCYVNFDKLLKPRLVNVQALLSMALIALKYYRYAIFEIIFSQACEIAKIIGLHQQAHQTSRGDATDTQRRNVFWALFIIDKQQSLISGKNCHLHNFDCDVPLPDAIPEAPLNNIFIGSIKLACIQEDIYRSLYSAESKRISSTQLQNRVDNLMRRLRHWSSENGQLLQNNNRRSELIFCFALEQQYAFRVFHILIQRRSTGGDSRLQRVRSSREALGIVKSLCEVRNTAVGHLILERLFLFYPLIAFLELYMNTVESFSPDYSADVDLMTFVVEAADYQASRSSTTSYSAKVRAATTLCTSIAQSVKHSKESSPSKPGTPAGVQSSEQSPVGQHDSSKSIGSWEFSSSSQHNNTTSDSFMFDINDTSLYDGTQGVEAQYASLSMPGNTEYSLCDPSFLPAEFCVPRVDSGISASGSSAIENHPISPITGQHNDLTGVGSNPFQSSLTTSRSNGSYCPQNLKDWQSILAEDQLDFTSILNGLGGVMS
ncbi:hypothetical protein AOQ84DRAFT_311826 [Glonium stellatum]|uniref:Zn(2)-C6 fungal-type domain-containing protein n=1 Tax=Glonium stellatum TaxID=574774 RepID=A0A8E2F8P1_9PEZI|nr:hypothetical protein AOQ84DRAFT_311826 [Glonium stellatum]